MEIQKANKKWYNQIADVYDYDNQKVIKKEKPEIERLIKEVKELTNNNRFLDLCCGTGVVSIIARKYFDNIYAVDIAEEMLKRLTRKDNGIKAICLDITKPLPFSDNQFDVVFSNSFLHHLPEDSTLTLFDELYRILRSNGILYMKREPNRIFFKRFKLLLKVFRSIKNMKRKYDTYRRFDDDLFKHVEAGLLLYDGIDPEDIKNRLRIANFREEKIVKSFPPFYFDVIAKK